MLRHNHSWRSIKKCIKGYKQVKSSFIEVAVKRHFRKKVLSLLELIDERIRLSD